MDSKRYYDYDVIEALKWFKSFLNENDWAKRKRIIENKISNLERETEPFSESILDGTLILDNVDQIGWYMYLIECLIHEPFKYEFYQGARIVPVFKMIGMNLEILKGIKGVNEKIRTLIRKRMSEADSILFEILTAILWVSNGWNVEFIDENNSLKTPDLYAKKDGKEWYIECKRQRKTSDYAYRETAKRLNLISKIAPLLLEKNILLDIVFHIEIVNLPDTYLYDLLREKINSNLKSGKLLSNTQIDIDVSFIDINSIQKYLDINHIKYPSPKLDFLITEKHVDNIGFTSGVFGKFVRMGEGKVNNIYLKAIEKAYGVCCSCDASESITAKARDIKSQIQSAIEQFDLNQNSIIHIGIETFDGPEIEMERVGKIENTLRKLNPNDSSLKWIFCHFFQSYTRPEEIWIFDETVKTYTGYIYPKSPLSKCFLVIPDNIESQDIAHWERPIP